MVLSNNNCKCLICVITDGLSDRVVVGGGVGGASVNLLQFEDEKQLVQL